MKRFNSLVFVLFFLLSNTSNSFASHIVGGELNYKCLGNDQYEITVLVYRDSINGNPGAPFDDPIPLGLFDPVTGTYLSTEHIFYPGHTAIPIPSYLGNIVAPANIGFQKCVYKDTLTLPYRPNGYQLTYQRCCRNHIIANIVNPQSTGFTMTIEITEAALLGCNNSPEPILDVPLFLCVGDSFALSMAANDMDGDSLAYHFYTPFDGANQGNPAPNPALGPPYLPFTWQTPYTTNNPINTVYLDEVTGRFYGQISTLGHYALGVSILEYRAGVLISTTYRDFSITVISCTKTINVDKIAVPIDVSISPNPVYSQLSINLESSKEVHLSIYTALGQELVKQSFYNQTQVEMGDLPKGLYFVSLEVDGQQVVRKIVKE
jgi:hypothetical protein